MERLEGHTLGRSFGNKSKKRSKGERKRCFQGWLFCSCCCLKSEIGTTINKG
ncbi:hypothetical protein HanIR_Chr14g0681471 [Helianthus annuus]|nr:hypothetical protein HanIR_Chr14g0681471 [Helianthus annuus]